MIKLLQSDSKIYYITNIIINGKILDFSFFSFENWWFVV